VPDLGNGPGTTLNPSRLLDDYFSTETHAPAVALMDQVRLVFAVKGKGSSTKIFYVGDAVAFPGDPQHVARFVVDEAIARGLFHGPNVPLN
jgi:hypothetical protein